MSKQGHQPQRFDVFYELKDRSGFTIPGSQHVFKYDRYGGWFDQHRNYYDKNGNPEDPPSDDAYSDDHSRSNSSDNQDEFEKEFGRPKDYLEDEEDHTNVIQLQRIAANIEELNLYPSNGPFRVHFKNIGYFSKREEVFKWFKAKVPGVSNVIFFNNEKGFNGRGYFIVDNIKAGEQLIKLEGQKYGDRQVSFDLESVEDFLLTPLEPHELKADFNQKGGKKYVNKSQATKQEVKQEVPPSTSSSTKPATGATGTKPKPTYVKIEENEPRSEVKVEIKPIKIEQKIIAPVEQVKVVENLEDFATYTFNKKAFPKKSSFKEWLTEHKFTETDYQAVEKIPGNEEFAKITMKKKVYSKLNNTNYNGEKIVFKQQ